MICVETYLAYERRKAAASAQVRKTVQRWNEWEASDKLRVAELDAKHEALNAAAPR